MVTWGGRSLGFKAPAHKSEHACVIMYMHELNYNPCLPQDLTETISGDPCCPFHTSTYVMHECVRKPVHTKGAHINFHWP